MHYASKSKLIAVAAAAARAPLARRAPAVREMPAEPLEFTAAGDLPVLPSLNEKHLRQERVTSTSGVALEALVPAHKPYICGDPQAPALVLVPGLGMDGLGFIRQLPLGARFDLHLFQMPNDPAPGEAGLGHFARHVEDYIHARGLDKRPGGVIVGGCSMGGAVSLHVATRGRVALRGLLMIGSFGHHRHVSFIQRWAAPLAWVLPLHRSRFIARRVVKHTRLFGAVSPEEADWLCGWKVQRSQRYFGRAALALTRQDQLGAARSLSVPTLLLHGPQDRILPQHASEELHAAIPGSRFVSIPDSGHAVFFTHAERVNSEVLGMLER